MNQIKFYLFFCMTIVLSCNTKTTNITKPELLVFGNSMSETKKRISPYCESIIEKMDEPIQLPTAQNSQSQLDCNGFTYAGKKRKLELIFADDALDIIWILTEAEEEKHFVNKLSKQHGEPSHIKEDVTFFLDSGVAVRNKPHELLFISERLKAPYKEWLNSSN